jgi:hypothetical protein
MITSKLVRIKFVQWTIPANWPKDHKGLIHLEYYSVKHKNWEVLRVVGDKEIQDILSNKQFQQWKRGERNEFLKQATENNLKLIFNNGKEIPPH